MLVFWFLVAVIPFHTHNEFGGLPRWGLRIAIDDVALG
jgi:hypothetical protein